jgi:hypothetical protein
MTDTTIGLPDRYRPLDQIGPDEPTPTGVIRCWRAKDRVLNRDVAIRVHTPAGDAAHAWITRALTAGGLATPALAMVYDASEGTLGAGNAPGTAAYVVNEWIDGETLTERLRRGPLPERELRTVMRRLAEGVAEAHRVGLAVGGLTTDNVVLRPNGLVGLRAVPAATGTMDGDITALGALLEACLTGSGPGSGSDSDSDSGELSGPPDLVALARRARPGEPGQGLTSVAAMVALLNERPRGGSTGHRGAEHRGSEQRTDESDSGWLRRLRERRGEGAPPVPVRAAADAPAEAPAADGPVRLDPHTLPPVPPVRPGARSGPLTAADLGGDTIDAGAVSPTAGPYARSRTGAPAGDRWADAYDDPFPVLDDDDLPPDEGDIEDDAQRHKFVVVGLPLLALVLVVALAWWLGSTVLSVTDEVDDLEGSTPSASAPAVSGSQAPTAAAGAAVAISGAEVFDPEGDGEPENTGDIPQSFDTDPSTAWSTLTYRGSPAFGNLKPGVGVVYDLGSEQELAAAVLTTTTPGATVEIRTGTEAIEGLDDYEVAASDTLEETTELTFEEPVTARYVLVWITGLVPGGEGFSASLAEVEFRAAG